MPKVSICIPCCNNPEDVKRLLHSIKEQSYKDYEIIISDDSGDNRIEELVRELQESADVIQEVSTLDCARDSFLPAKKISAGRIFYRHNAHPLGVVLNWNAAIRMAHGDYIKIMFSDDWFSGPGSLSALVKMLEDHPQADLAFSGNWQCRLDATSLPLHAHSSQPRAASDLFIQDLRRDFRTLFCSNQIGAPSVTIYRRVPVQTKDHGKEAACPLFDEESGFASDVFLYMQILERNPAFAYTKDPLVCIGLHARQYTETFSEKDPGKYKDYRLLFQKYRLWEQPEYRAYFLREYLIPYHKGIDESRKLHIPDSQYRKEWVSAQKAGMKSFFNARLSRRNDTTQ